MEGKGVGVATENSEMQWFNDFILHLDLTDILMVGNQFTWFNLAGSSCSRLDRFLITNGLVEMWGIDCQVVGERSVSNHCPIWAKGMVKD